MNYKYALGTIGNIKTQKLEGKIEIIDFRTYKAPTQLGPPKEVYSYEVKLIEVFSLRPGLDPYHYGNVKGSIFTINKDYFEKNFVII